MVLIPSLLLNQDIRRDRLNPIQDKNKFYLDFYQKIDLKETCTISTIVLPQIIWMGDIFL
jgi:hypothetical protein